MYRAEVDQACFLLKAYFQHPLDPRDRLGVEYAFTSFAWENGLRCVPRPLEIDRTHQLGLYEFVQGRSIDSGEITQERVMQAVEFYRGLNRHRESLQAKALPKASEACFSIADHLACVKRRLDLLRSSVPPSDDLHQGVLAFVREDLSEAWESVVEFLLAESRRLGISVQEEIPREESRLSPSDFGFHNALLESDGRLRFIDFEYAGWDDPAKAACDFFCLQGVSVPEVYCDRFVEGLAGDLPRSSLYPERVRLLFPVHRMKWCCILLNDFLPLGAQRRSFAREENGLEERKELQLMKARSALERFYP
ncbi:MAG: phosphotransferase [Candidatus Omnitrophica bacterium]|nr:phosphotransferase [Candidatus Omnitrophota bacterium]